ncbi:hypothetical protein K0U07_05500 [bacterium]|nr:hypothetical protein [bacterium]
MNKFSIFLGCFFSLCAIDIPRLDIPVEIEGENVYKFYKGAAPVGVVRIPVAVGAEIGDYEVVIENLSGSFSSRGDDLSYAAARNPRFDTVKGSFPVQFTKVDSLKELPFLVQLPAEKVLSPGRYVAEVPVTIKKEGEVVAERLVSAYFDVEEQLEARVFLDGEERDDEDIVVAFGEIEGKAEKELILTVRANTNVKIAISSANNGRLVLDGEQDKYTPYHIPYTLKHKGEEISLLTKTTILTKNFEPNQGEITTRMKLLLHPNIKENFSGKYRDRICVSVTPAY